MVQFEKPPKPGHVRLIEGILLLILLAIVVGALLSVILSAAGRPALPPSPNRAAKPAAR